MTEKRLKRRLRRRLALRFGTDVESRLGFTEDISLEGMFIQTPHVAAPGSRLTVTLMLQDGQAVTLEGLVIWAKKAPAQMIRLVRKCGLGVRIESFAAGEELYRKLCERTLSPA